MSRRVILTNGIAPYRIPLFNALAELQRDLHVLFVYEREPGRLWKPALSGIRFSYDVLGSSGSGLTRAVRVVRALNRLRPSVLMVGGWGVWENWVALGWATGRGVPVAFWGGVSLNSLRRTSAPFRFMRRWFVRRCVAAATYSSTTASFLAELGLAPEHVISGCNIGNVSLFYETVGSKRTALRHDRCRLLYVGQLIPRKGLLQLLQALTILDHEGLWELTIVGSGPDEQRLRAAASPLKNVRFVPFCQESELATHFGAADVFVLPSLRETGAIVTSEALASGLYVLVSRWDGVAPDLITAGVNGEFFEPNDAASVAEVVGRTITSYRSGTWNAAQIAREFIERKPLEQYVRVLSAAFDRAADAW